jgi:hypothetical protein
MAGACTRWTHPSRQRMEVRVTERRTQASLEADTEGSWEDADLSDLLQELRILLPGAQTLTAFLIILPFSPGFALIDQAERWVYMATFLCSVSSLILFTAPAAQHRLERPLRDRVRFKETATRQIVVGLIPLSIALILSTQLVINEVGGRTVGIGAAVIVAGLVGFMWWLIPLYRRPHS